MASTPATSDDAMDPWVEKAVADLAYAARWHNTDRIAGRTRLVWKQRRFVIVSTVLIPGFEMDGSDDYFETQVLGQLHLLPHPLDTIGWSDIGGRYATRESAFVGHKAWCWMLAGWLNHAGRHTVTWQEMTTW